MTAARRVLVLLDAYEALTTRETHALRRGDIDHALTLEARKLRLAEALGEARANAVLSGDETAALTRRVRALELRERDNLAFLRLEMDRTRAALDDLERAVFRTRQVRRGYTAGAGPAAVRSGIVLGCA